jgi:hypothetical protein
LIFENETRKVVILLGEILQVYTVKSNQTRKVDNSLKEDDNHDNDDEAGFTVSWLIVHGLLCFNFLHL